MKNIYLLPTDKPSELYINMQGVLSKSNSLLLRLKSRHIYITSDEYIGLSYYLDGNLVRKGVIDDKDYWEVRKDYKKIILTTDQDLISDGVQAIPDEFLEWFVNNSSCEEVEVEINSYMDKNISDSITFTDYKIIIPKEEPKQETLEEFAERLKEEIQYGASQSDIIDYLTKWQQEQYKKMYSEEDLKEAFDNGVGSGKYQQEYGENSRGYIKFYEWFEQFKKK